MSNPLQLRRRRVLVVDDNQDFTSAMRILLEALDQEVQVANSGPRALELASVYKPQLVFLDLALPVMDGYEVARALREQAGDEERIIIVLSGWGDEQARARAAAAGVDQHWLKPIDADLLTDYLAGIDVSGRAR